MPHHNPPDSVLKDLLTDAQVIAMVGASSAPDRPSNGIFRKLLSVGYRVIPVNPNQTEVLGQRAFGSLTEVPDRVDIVSVFRRPEFTPKIAEQAVAIGARALWLQSGIWSEAAADRAKSAGILVVMDACIGVIHGLLRIPPKAKLTPQS